MSKLTELLAAAVAHHVNQIALPRQGVVTDFFPLSKTAVVTVSVSPIEPPRSFELPWPLDPMGMYVPDPEPGTQVTIGFTGGNASLPYIQAVHDPIWQSGTRTRLRRNPGTIATRVDKLFL